MILFKLAQDGSNLRMLITPFRRLPPYEYFDN